MLEKIVSQVNDIVWNPGLVVLLIAAGLYFSVRTRFVQVRRFKLMLKSLFSKKEGAKGISSFEAFCIALSGRVGTGNIVGVATAIAFGGPGAVFWMWVVAFFGASTAFVESTLAQIYKFPHHSGYRGGPFSFIEHGLGKKWLGIAFAAITVLACGFFLTTVQSNGVSSAIKNAFPVAPLTSGIALAVILGLVIFGGVKRIARVASIVTPFMALGYILMSLVVIGFHIQDVPAVFASIVTNAFGINPICGGIIGSTIAMGVKRGIFSNEAGQGTGAIVSAATDVPHPAQQGLAQALNYTQSAVDTVFKGFGSQFVSIAMVFFAFSTIMAYYFYAETSIIYLFRGREGKGEKVAIRIFQVLMLAAVVFGAVREADVVWQLGDIGVGLMAWFTVIAILILCPKAIKALKEFEKVA